MVSRLGCSLCEPMAGSLSAAITAMSLAKVALVDPGEVGRSAAYRKYARRLALASPVYLKSRALHRVCFQ
jgi:hypothetical protein